MRLPPVLQRLRNLLPHRAEGAPSNVVLHPRRIPSIAQWRLLPTVFTPTEWRIVRLLASLAVVGFLLGIALLAYQHLTLVPNRGGSLTEVVIGSPQYVNPLLATGSEADESLTKLLYAGLFGRNASGAVIPVLAEGYGVNAEATVYTVKLREHLVWPDGEPFTPDDVLTTVDVLQDPRFRLNVGSRLKGVAVARVDDRTLTFTLPSPNAQFPALLTTGILPSHLWANVDPSKFALVEYNQKPVGMGPFKFSELRRDRSGAVKTYTVVRNPSWPLEATRLDRLTLRFVPDTDSAVRALTDRSADTFAAETPGEVRGVSRGVEHPIPRAQFVAVFLNERDAVWKDAAVRRAISTGTDRAALAALPSVAGRVVDTPVLPGVAGHLNDALFPGLDRAAAEKALEDAGWKRPAAGQPRTKGDVKLAITLTTVDDPVYVAVAQALKAQWEAAGVSVTVDAVEATRFPKDVLKARKFSALLFAEQPGLDGDPYPFWHSSQQRDPGLNLSTFFRKDIDDALERSRSAKDAAAHQTALADFQRKFAEELPALVLYQPELVYLAPNRLGLPKDTIVASPSDRFHGVADWFVRRRFAWK